MRTVLRRLLLAAALGTVLSFPACAGLIYDDDIELEDRGVWYAEEGRFSMVDASEYTTWVYVDLEEGKAVRVDEYGGGEPEEVPERWHFAMHRWDCKTNGAEALETRFGTIAELVASGAVPGGVFVADTWTDDKVAYDMSDMMNGNMLYAASDYNAELSKWMDVTIAYVDGVPVMPPTYKPSNRAYLLRMADGKMAAVRFTGSRNPSGASGYISFDYLYPLEF